MPFVGQPATASMARLFDQVRYEFGESSKERVDRCVLPARLDGCDATPGPIRRDCCVLVEPSQMKRAHHPFVAVKKRRAL